MEGDREGDISELLQAWRGGDEGALERLVPVVDKELRRIVRQRLAKTPPDPTLTTTSVLQEVYLRLIAAANVNFRGRAHFFALCAQIVRGILVDHARAHLSAKRGGGVPHLPLEEALAVSQEWSSDLVAVDDALGELARVDPRKARVVDLRFFGGMSVEETAEVLEVSPETVTRDWRLARLWLMRHISRRARQDAC